MTWIFHTDRLKGNQGTGVQISDSSLSLIKATLGIEKNLNMTALNVIQRNSASASTIFSNVFIFSIRKTFEESKEMD